jgi:ABC-type multidrug transport system fused ATPase/permease subunit
MVVVVQHGAVVAARPPSEFLKCDFEKFGLASNLEQSEESFKRQKSEETTAVEKPKAISKSGDRGPSQQEEEEREIGALSCAVWGTYAREMGVHVACVLAVLYIGKNFSDLAANFLLAGWSSDRTDVSEYLWQFSFYAVLSFTSVFFLAGRVLVFRYVSLKVSRKQHDRALWAVLRSPMSFLDTTPTGRIVNRFSSDLQRVDLELRYSAAGFLDQIVSMLIAMTVSAAYMPLLFVLAPLAFVYNYVQRRFRTTARELQRLLSRSRGPIFAGLDEAMIGVSSIRAYQKQMHFIHRNQEKVETNVRAQINLMCCNRWLAIRLRAIGTIPVAVITFTLVLQNSWHLSFMTFTGATAGLILKYALQLTWTTEGILQSLTNMELCLVALERLQGYGNLKQEPELARADDTCLNEWPSTGTIEFDNVVMRYRAELPTVLNGISFTIPGGTSVGVIGRTGAGKSSLLQALFRMGPLDAGTIRIDGEDISAIGLHTLRRRVAIIPQDPVGFTGSIRFNLDPFGEHSDEEILKELENVQLTNFVRSHNEGLEYHLTAGGENLSVGQRQLLCAARAFLRTSKILVLDEATASVDLNTDELIQRVLQNAVTMRKLTTITIAHRINTILGSDNVLVMDRGVVGEFGPTQMLSVDSSSMFYTFIHPKAVPST